MAASKIRTFVAIDISPAARSAIGAMTEALSGQTRVVRWVPQSNLHLTLKFIGDTDPGTITGLHHALNLSVQGVPSFDFTVSTQGCFPNCGRPRILWLGISTADDRMAQLQRRVEEALYNRGIDRDPRRFRPHLTLARVRQGKRVEPSFMTEFKAFKLGEYRVTAKQVNLMQSELKQGGAYYTVLHQATLQDPDSKTVQSS